MVKVTLVLGYLLQGAFFSMAQRDLLESGARQPRKLLINVYAALYGQTSLADAHHGRSFAVLDELGLKDVDRLTDALIFLDRYFAGEDDRVAAEMTPSVLRDMILNGQTPAYTGAEIAAHIEKIYIWHNGADHPMFAVGRVKPQLFAYFLIIADYVDGDFDVALSLPNLEQFYDMLLVQNIPLPAICYNCREDQGWQDRRALIGHPRLQRELPKSMLRLAKKKMDDERKLQKILDYVQSRVKASGDGWETDYWQDAWETLLVEEGDCEDFAILFQSIAELVGVETHIVVGDIVRTDWRGEQEVQGHAWIQYGQQVIDPIMGPTSSQVQYLPHFTLNSREATVVLPKEQFSPATRWAAR